MLKPKTIKISHPRGWETSYSGHWNYLNLTPGLTGIWGDFRIELNNKGCNECDYWVVHEGLDEQESVNCPPQNVIFIPGEEKTQVPEYPQDYLRQFGLILTSRDDLKHPNQIRDQYLCAWQVKKTYDELNHKLPCKTKDLSAIISNSTWLEGHKKRFAFTNKLKGHFKDRLDWYCKGENFVEDKWDGLVEYKYSLCIENSSHPHYFTEKLMDAFLAGCLPFYWGCPNITEYFPDKALILLDVDDFEKSIRVIEQAIKERKYEENLEFVREARNLVLNKYQIIAGLIRIIEANKDRFGNVRNRIVLKPKSIFEKRSIMHRAYKKLRSYTNG